MNRRLGQRAWASVYLMISRLEAVDIFSAAPMWRIIDNSGYSILLSGQGWGHLWGFWLLWCSGVSWVMWWWLSWEIEQHLVGQELGLYEVSVWRGDIVKMQVVNWRPVGTVVRWWGVLMEPVRDFFLSVLPTGGYWVMGFADGTSWSLFFFFFFFYNLCFIYV